ncbi:NAD(P)/FAD-dependent oxidoreductase [Kocuria sp. M1R5S2]|uniref:NAD(P)/FAD-dependent oxidoreductase n=1 Tax=Kocuria rhizosphaerae TaxID=3376285 RepID=UPI0037A60C76
MTPHPPPEADVLVVGGGPAGLAAATWLGRYLRHTLVVDAGEQRNRHADHAHGLLGRDPARPEDLLRDARAGLAQYPHVTVHEGRVEEIERSADGTFHAVVDGDPVVVRRVVLATGVRDECPDVTGFEDHYGTDVHHCPSCDGFEIRGGHVVVLGAGERLPAFAAELLDWAGSVCVVTDTGAGPCDEAQWDVLAEHGIDVVDGVAEALLGEPGALEGVRLADGSVVSADAVMFSYAHHAANGLARQLGCELDDHGRVVVDDLQLSSVDGVYAAGDITARLQLVPIAIGQGTSAGIACATSLRGHRTTVGDVSPAPPTRRFTRP